MKKIDTLLIIGGLGLLSFATGIICAILSFTLNISIYFSLSFITLAFLLIVSVSKAYRVRTLRDMDDYINKHDVVECHKCHTLNDIDANYCKNCGHKLLD